VRGARLVRRPREQLTPDATRHAARLVARACEHIEAARAVLVDRPAPLTAWKIEALAARVFHAAGRKEDAAAARATARSIVESIAAATRDERLRACFLGAPAIAEVLVTS
jgi:hypothetical protein